MWDRLVLCGLEESCGSHVEQILLMWDSVVLCGTEKSYVEGRSLMWNKMVLVGQSTPEAFKKSQESIHKLRT